MAEQTDTPEGRRREKEGEEYDRNKRGATEGLDCYRICGR
jgi:hypothetical protein